MRYTTPGYNYLAGVRFESGNPIASENSTVFITNCTISNAERAIEYRANSNSSIVNSKILNCETGIFITGSTLNISSSTIFNVRRGRALEADGAEINGDDVTFSNNGRETGATKGGANYFDGNTIFNCNNCHYYNNSAEMGGAIHATNAHVSLNNSTFSGNKAIIVALYFETSESIIPI